MLLLWSTQNYKSALLKWYCKLSNIICWAVSYFLPCFHYAPCTGFVWGYISPRSGGAGYFRAEMAASEVETASQPPPCSLCPPPLQVCKGAPSFCVWVEVFTEGGLTPCQLRVAVQRHQRHPVLCREEQRDKNWLSIQAFLCNYRLIKSWRVDWTERFFLSRLWDSASKSRCVFHPWQFISRSILIDIGII